MSDSEGEPSSGPTLTDEWQRLDPKVTIIGPVSAFRQFLFPALIALIGIGTRQPKWLLYAAPLVILVSIGIGVLPWLTTRFRITGGQLVVATGLINKKRLTAPLDRIRSVDLEATLLHRLLKLEKVEVGTGVDDTMIVLNALSVEQAAHLRGVLLSRRAPTTLPSPLAPDAEPAPAVFSAHSAPVDSGQDLVAFSPAWARFAPFSLGRLVIALAALGAVSQFTRDIRVDVTGDVWDRLIETSLALIVVGGFIVALVLWTVLSMVAYLVQWWDMRLVREDGNLRLTRGLFTTTSTTIEEARVRGVQLRETALLRTVDGGELHALVTGLDESVYAVLPQAPTSRTREVAGSILGSAEPIEVPLVQHGPRALRRCYIRNLRALSPLLAPVIALTVLLEKPWWLSVMVALVLIPVGVVFGRMEYAHLGHALTRDHLVAGSGVTARTRTVLQRAGVVGWVVSQSFFQRRRGLATLVATTAAGSEKVVIRDVPLDAAVVFARDATPGVIEEFMAA